MCIVDVIAFGEREEKIYTLLEPTCFDVNIEFLAEVVLQVCKLMLVVGGHASASQKGGREAAPTEAQGSIPEGCMVFFVFFFVCFVCYGNTRYDCWMVHPIHNI